mgnify:CR=1 FL=1
MTSNLVKFLVFIKLLIPHSPYCTSLCNDNKIKNDIKRTSHKRYVKNTFDTGERRNHTHLCLWEKTNSSKVKAYQLGLLVVVEDTWNALRTNGPPLHRLYVIEIVNRTSKSRSINLLSHAFIILSITAFSSQHVYNYK